MPVAPVILDTDIGTDVDDALALGLALASPEIDLRAVTVVSGDVDLRARIAKTLLSSGGRPDIPVYSGLAEPVNESRNFLWLGHEGRAIVGAAALPLDGSDAVGTLAAMELDDPCDLVAIGPLTNIAAALVRSPELADVVPRLTLMGGSLGVSEDPTTPPIEYNLNSDAESSVLVLQAGIPTTIVPLDVTWQVYLRTRELARLRTSRSPLVQRLCDAMEIWWSVHRELFAGQRTYSPDIVCFLHDPLALSLLIDASFVTVETLRLEAEIVDGIFRLRQSDEGREIDVATRVDAPAFIEFVVERLMGLE
jgi:purine nucleosidase